MAPARMSPSGGPCCRQGAGGGGGSGAGAGGWRRGPGAPIGLPTGGSGSESTNGFTPWSLHARESAASSASGQGARQSAHAAGRARARDRARHARWYWWWHTGHKVRRRRSAPFVEIGSKQTGHTDGETGGSFLYCAQRYPLKSTRRQLSLGGPLPPVPRLRGTAACSAAAPRRSPAPAHGPSNGLVPLLVFFFCFG